MSKRAAVTFLLLAMPLAACAGGKSTLADAPAVRSCFKTTEVTAFQPIDRETALIQVGSSRAYHLRVTGVCPDLNWSDRVVLSNEDDPANAATICTGSAVTIMSPSPRGGFQECYGNEILPAPPLSRPAGS